MIWRNTAARWGAVAQGFHWVMAALVFTLIPLGLIATEMGFSKAKLEVFGWHKSIGLLVLALVVLRIAWRLANTTPSHPPGTPRYQLIGASAVHLAIYALLVLMPLSGWVINSAADFPFKVFWLIPLPDIVAKSEATKELFETVHGTMAWVLITLLVLHIGAALHHHFIRRNDTLRRMLPWGNRT